MTLSPDNLSCGVGERPRRQGAWTRPVEGDPQVRRDRNVFQVRKVGPHAPSFTGCASAFAKRGPELTAEVSWDSAAE